MSDPRVRTPSGTPIEIAGTARGEQFVTGRVYETDRQRVPGVGTGAAYLSGDAFGTMITFQVPLFGTISNVVFLDHDDEGLTKELVLFNRPFTATADNAAFAVSDGDLSYALDVVLINTFYDFTNNQMGSGTPALSYVAPLGRLYGQLVTRGADNIAAGSVPEIFFVVV
jgi:hypothetical protein